MNYSDNKTLIHSLKKGEEKAFIYLVDKFSQRLFAYALTLTNDKDISQDILQNVFLKTWEKRNKINISTSLQNYLFRSIYNEFVNQYNKKRATMRLEHSYFKALDNAIEIKDENSFAKIIEHITEEIQRLPPKCREVFILSRKEGLTNIEISNYLNLSIKSVEAHITKAFSTLRKNLGERVDISLFMLFGIYDNTLNRD
ncbi:RNA polymerase sigma factor [Flavivirga algicola]|uniref:RNA polymerase sigma-70 factor n=1 Tax=Flavivirga algicola TaxID=2729136 RepID=A0ABX1RV76_9FLAO|nr:RNA polymerase sigma-70 factor [Flavivirga algicola]NMH86900.1 RNA polymerase sigma-70 factor [Flavivirga algicola]